MRAVCCKIFMKYRSAFCSQTTSFCSVKLTMYSCLYTTVTYKVKCGKKSVYLTFVKHKLISQHLVYNNDVKVKQSRYRPGVAQRVPGS